MCAFNICLKTLELDEEAASIWPIIIREARSQLGIAIRKGPYAKSHSVKTLKRTQGYSYALNLKVSCPCFDNIMSEKKEERFYSLKGNVNKRRPILGYLGRWSKKVHKYRT